jgi:hypothetical protein
MPFFPPLQTFFQLASLEVRNRSTTWNASGMKVMKWDDFVFFLDRLVLEKFGQKSNNVHGKIGL